MKTNKENMKPLVYASLIQPLISKAMEYQTKGYGTAFIFLHGHCSKIDIDLYPYGWSLTTHSQEKHNLYLDIDEENFDKIRLDNVINRIDEIMKNHLTEQEHAEVLNKKQLEQEREQYEKLKLKFG